MSSALTVVTVPGDGPAPRAVTAGQPDPSPTALGRLPAAADLSAARVVALDDTPPSGGSGNLSGLAGGVLAGNYPNPSFAQPMATAAALSGHVAATTPHPAYDDLPSLTLQFQNGLI